MIGEQAYIRLLGLHFLLAVLIYLFEPLSKLYFIAILSLSVFMIISARSDRRHFYVLLACSYVVGCEVFLRMTDGNFLYEISKYLIIFFIVLGMLFEGFKMKAIPYLIYILLLVPGIFVAGASVTYGTNIRTAIAFNLSGPVCLGIVALYCYDKRVKFNDLKHVILAALLPLFTTAVYLFLYTPNIRDVVTGTYSNFVTSGGFGPNQVATVLGFGMFAAVTLFFLESKSKILKIINLLVLGIIAYRGVVTFSRGGIITGVAIILAFLFIYYISSVRKARVKIIRQFYVLLGIFVAVWLVSSVQTMGFIDLRYANKDAAGREKEDITTGRTDLISFELNEFIDNPFLGIGVGKVKELRFEKEGERAASHNEFSRILAEHGLFGVMAFLIILFTPLIYRIKNRRNIFFYSFLIFWFLTINHSSMRIAAPAFIYGLSVLNVNYNRVKKPALHRK